MKDTFLRGQLTAWNDDRGFGFITPDDSKGSVFIHISALKGMSRRPVIGDVILYKVEDNHGKIRAIHASIVGVSVQQQRSMAHNRSPKSGSGIGFTIGIASIIVIVVIGLFTFIEPRTPSKVPPIVTMITKPDCVIKGNISISTGNKLYHLPGMEDYDATVISPEKGERWFCTEAEAISQGWKKAPR